MNRPTKFRFTLLNLLLAMVPLAILLLIVDVFFRRRTVTVSAVVLLASLAIGLCVGICFGGNRDIVVGLLIGLVLFAISMALLSVFFPIVAHWA